MPIRTLIDEWEDEEAAPLRKAAADKKAADDKAAADKAAADADAALERKIRETAKKVIDEEIEPAPAPAPEKPAKKATT